MCGSTTRYLVYFLFIAGGVRSKLDDDSANRQEQSLRTAEQTQKEIVSKLSKKVNEEYGLSGDLSFVPSVRQGENMLKELCEMNSEYSDDDTFNTAHTAVRNIEKCFDGIISFSELPSKIEEARPHGNLDQVFHGYCRRSDEMKVCIKKFLADIDPCLAEDQKKGKYTIQNISEAILGFACENEGDYIALFISEKGPQCISSHQPGIEQCVRRGLNDTRSIESFIEMINSFNNSDVSVEEENPFNMTFQLHHCRNGYQIRNCIVAELKKCHGSTPANVIESIFNLIQRTTTCSKYTIAELDPENNSLSNSLESTLSLLIATLTILLCKTTMYT